MTTESTDVLFVANYPANEGYAWDNIERLFARIGDRLSERGLRTSVAYPELIEPPRTLEGSAARPVELDASLNTKASLTSTMSFLRQHDVRLMYLTDRPRRHLSYLMLRLAGLKSIVIHDRISGAGTVPAGLKRWLKWLAGRAPMVTADRCIAVSNFVARRLRSVELIPPEEIITVYNGFPVDEYSPRTQQCSAGTHSEFSVAAGRPIVACASRASPEKGVHHLFRAFDQSLRQLNTAKQQRPVLIYLGDGPQLEELDRIRRRLESSEDIILGGYRPDAVNILRDAAVFAVPSVWQDAFPSAVLEPMFLGKPIVATEVGGIPEMIDSGETGLLVPPGDEDALADALKHLLRHPEKSKEIGSQARERATERFPMRRQLDQITELIDQELDSAARSGRDRKPPLLELPQLGGR